MWPKIQIVGHTILIAVDPDLDLARAKGARTETEMRWAARSIDVGFHAAEMIVGVRSRVCNSGMSATGEIGRCRGKRYNERVGGVGRSSSRRSTTFADATPSVCITKSP